MKTRPGLLIGLFTLITLIPLIVLAGEYSAEERQTINIVDKQLLAYNNQDIVAFTATYHEDVEIHHFPGGLQYKGKQELISRYGPKFARLKCLEALSTRRIVEGRFLVDHELAQSCSKEAGVVDRRIEVIVMYEVEDGLIKRVIFSK